MAAILTEELIYEILSAVEEVPAGKVASYGQIARLIGRDKNARLVGKVLSMSEYYGSYPCHRIVNHAGRRVFNTCKWNNMAETAELRLFLCQVYKNLMLYGVVFHVKQWYNGGYETLV